MEQTKEVSLLAKFDELAGEMGSANKAAQRIGIPASTISQLKKGAYSGNKDAQFAKLAAYFDTKTEGAESYSEVDYAPTSISEKIYQTIKTCQIKGGVAIATGDSGIGKTKAVQKYHADNPLNSIVITVNPCFKSAKAVLKLIALELGVPISQSTDDLWIAITQKLHDGMVIIIDEGQLLTFHGIETIRSFADYFTDKGQTLGVAFVGDNGIEEKFEGKTRRNYRQINNRKWLSPKFVTTDIQREDVDMMFPLLVSSNMEQELEFLHKVAQSEAGLRGAVRLFSQAYDNGCYTLKGLASMAKFMRIDVRSVVR